MRPACEEEEHCGDLCAAEHVAVREFVGLLRRSKSWSWAEISRWSDARATGNTEDVSSVAGRYASLQLVTSVSRKVRGDI